MVQSNWKHDHHLPHIAIKKECQVASLPFMIFRTGGGCKSGKPDLALHNREQLILVRSNKLVTASVDVDNLYLVVVFQMFAQFCDVNVH